MIFSIIVALAAGSAPEPEPPHIQNIVELHACPAGSQGWFVQAECVEADAQELVVVRQEQDSRGRLGSSDIVAIDLKTGQQLSRVEIAPTLDAALAISKDGREVIVVKKVDDANWGPWHACLWRFDSDARKLKEYSELNGPNFFLRDAKNPAISPDGSRAAIMGYRDEADSEGAVRMVQCVGVLDLTEGTVRAVSLLRVPNPDEWDPDWYLRWSEDGTSIYAIIHHGYLDEPTSATLYRVSPTVLSATALLEVPPTTIGFGPGDSIVVADTLGRGWGPHCAFGVVALSNLIGLSLPNYDARIAFSNALAMTSVIAPNVPSFDSFQHVWVGRKHAYAEVVKLTTGVCEKRVLVELSPPSSRPD